MAVERQGRCLRAFLLAIFLATAVSQEASPPFCSRIFQSSMYCFNIVDFNFVRQHLPADNSNFTTFFLQDSADLVLTAEDFKHPAFKELTGLSCEECNLANINSGLFAGLTTLTSVYLNLGSIHELKSGTFGDFGGVTDFTLAGNHIEKIAPDIFKNMTNVQILDLEDNEITSIPDNLFVGLRELFYLGLSDNKLTSLNNETFNGLAIVGILNLANNFLSSISPDAFSALSELYRVDLGNNKLHHLAPEVFEHNHQMSYLDLSGNDLHNLENFPLHIPSLAVLELGLCKIHLIPANYFENLNGLIQINLNNNSLSHLEPGIFKNMPKLFNIYIDYNNFTSINVETFSGLVELSGGTFLTSNPWDCYTTEMRAVKEYCLANEMDFEEVFECNKVPH